ncbi:MAG: carbohydrate kinase family protein [Chloroflexi bacterium]|nr:carbohydrate kinase family protein [Chloroflexota bacterium]
MPDKRFDIIGLGVSTIDLLMLVDHLPAEEEILRADGFSAQGGGPVATAMAAGARAGGRVAMIDALGDDWRGDAILEAYAGAGVATDLLVRRTGQTSATAVILVRRGSGTRTIVWSPGTAPELAPEEIPFATIEQAAYLHVNGRHGEACRRACEHARHHGVQVSFDGGAGRYREETRQLVPIADVCIVAREFASRYTGEDDPLRAGPALLAAGPSLAAITDGVRGSWVFTRDSRKGFHQPSFPVEVVDTTGCGDTYHGVFLVALCRGLPPERAAELASAAAALNARHLGGRLGLPTMAEVDSFLGSPPAH